MNPLTSTKPAPSPNPIEIEGIKVKLSQPEDTDGRGDHVRQTIDIELVGSPALGGFYVVFSSERWAVDDEAEWQAFWRTRVTPLLDMASCRPPAEAPKKSARALAANADLEASIAALKMCLTTLPPADAAGRQPMTLVNPSDLRAVLRAIDRAREGNGATVS